MNGLLVIDKAGGMTSRDAVNRVQRRLSKRTKIGHTGTLDPLATGVLVVCVGPATRLAGLVQGMDKSYAARVRFGATSDTDDADGTLTPSPETTPPTETEVRAVFASFVGVIDQLPPAYSALKFEGKRAHELARRGEAVPLTSRPVRVDAVRLVRYEWPFADIEVDCGKGTYIRSIARDAGVMLGVGGMIETLRRTRVGPFTAEQGSTAGGEPDAGLPTLLPPATAVAGMTHVTLDPDAATRFRCGVAVFPPQTQNPRPGHDAAVFDAAGDLIGIGTFAEGGLVKPSVVLERWK